MPRVYTKAEEDWLRENYSKGDINDTLRKFKAEFGREASKQALFVKANKMGLHKDKHLEERGQKVEKRMRWSSPALKREREWMLENDKGNLVFETVEAFEREFGIRLTRTQVSLFRSTYGTQKRKSHGGGRKRVPAGTERRSKSYAFVKVAEEATVPQSKDNWKLKHVHIWEQANGPLPEKWVVLFADHDNDNFDLGNLVAMPKKYIARLNAGYEWHDRETLEAAINCVRLELAITDARNRPRACGVCGKTFEPAGPCRHQQTNTCPECLAQGRKSYKMRGRSGEAVCVVCGKRFAKNKRHQRRCPDCVAEHPKLNVDKHIERSRRSEGEGKASV